MMGIIKNNFMDKNILYFICSPNEKIRVKFRNILKNIKGSSMESHQLYKEILEVPGSQNEIAMCVRTIISTNGHLQNALKFIPRLFLETFTIIKTNPSILITQSLLSCLWNLFLNTIPQLIV